MEVPQDGPLRCCRVRSDSVIPYQTRQWRWHPSDPHDLARVPYPRSAGGGEGSGEHTFNTTWGDDACRPDTQPRGGCLCPI